MLDMDTHMLMVLMLMELFLLDPALVWTQSPKDLTQSLRELFHTTERDLLMLMPTLSMAMLDMDMDTLMLMELMLTELFLSVPALVWTQSPKDLTQLPKELLLTMLDTHTPMLDTHMPMLDTHMDMFHLDHPQELTQSPRVWTQSLKDLSTKQRVEKEDNLQYFQYL